MDKSIYVAMSGAKETLRAQAANNHNLANASTNGFRADLTAFMSRAVEGPGHDSRAYATTSTRRLEPRCGRAAQRPDATSTSPSTAMAGSPCRARTAAKPTRAPATCGSMRAGSCATARGWRCWATRPARRAAEHVARGRRPTARSRSCRWGRGRRLSRASGRIKLVNPPSADTGARHGRPVPAARTAATRRRRPPCGSRPARSSRATSTPPRRWST